MGGSEEEEEHPCFLGGGVLGVGSASHSVNIWTFELIFLFTSVDGAVLSWAQRNNYY